MIPENRFPRALYSKIECLNNHYWILFHKKSVAVSSFPAPVCSVPWFLVITQTAASLDGFCLQKIEVRSALFWFLTARPRVSSPDTCSFLSKGMR
ncbi:hypothetical protein CDAR_612151 [Caerostris darwini]|uniref:Uncharacterized protein n=1 Tax=Caerostris darwini TaxID=1538125 RepID=A0AAV4RWL3_9ARAC|nr:hypothetical protein CDAR_612151 [Caerostris darwini]